MNNNLLQAEAKLQSLIQDATRLLLSPQEVTKRLDEVAAAMFAQRLMVQITQHGQHYTWGALDTPPKLVLQTGKFTSEVEFQVLGDAWPQTSDEQRILPLLTNLATALWGEDMRPMGGLAWKRESVRVRLPESVERLRELGAPEGSIAILFADLDKFKDLNDQAGHEKGDDAIRLVNRELHNLCLRHGGLPFHPSGDEFYLILPDVGLLSMMEALNELRQSVLGHKFAGNDGRSHSVDLTLGLQFVRETITFEKIRQAIVEAEDSTKLIKNSPDITSPSSTKKEKRRGKLSIAGIGEFASTKIATQDFARLGTVIVRRRSCLSLPTFLDPRLGMMELIAEKNGLATEGLREEIEQVQKWLDVQTAGECTTGSLLQQQPPKVVPRIAAALAVASGLLRARRAELPPPANDLRVRFSSDGCLAEVVLNDRSVWGDPIPAGVTIAEVEIESQARRRDPIALIGVQVGLSDRLTFEGGVELPRDLLSHVVVVDDRPNSGGGLPDFWQAAVAQVCQSAVMRGGHVHIFAWGRASGKSETVQRLMKLDEDWLVDEISALAGISSMEVRDLEPLLKKNTRLVTTAHEVIESLYEIAPVLNVDQACGTVEHNAQLDALKREMLRPQLLQAIDGIRCKTAAQAYPTVIDVLRKAATRESADDAHQPLRELIAFKLVLETPNHDSVPGYLRRQTKDMQRYADEVLLQADGRIQKALKLQQIEAFKRELAACYPANAASRSTRRACLVVPHEPTTSGTPSPEGIVSAWASPRVGDGSQNIVDWVFVWRTVEAFIGLPYSLYGSIQLAESLLSQIAIPSLASQPNPTLRLGELTYVALSLHMRIDGVHRRIAKRIVDVSSE